MVGYSRLMADDDAATVETLQKYRATIARVIERHGGRVVNAPGDNILAELASAVDAVEAAAEVQRVLERSNLELPEDRRMAFRVGVNLGDVIEEPDGTIYGDGVNIAARLEALADAGGICISAKVLDEVESKLDFGFDFLGEQSVKNIAKPVRVYRLRSEAQPPQTQPASRRKPQLIGAAAVVSVLVGVIAIWFTYLPSAPHGAPATVAQIAAPAAVSDQPSIAVLPFTNMSGDAEQEYFADGISEDIITELSRFEGLLVIARNSTFRFKGQAVDVSDVARALGVRYVLEGGVRREGGRVRITAQLIDAKSGGHLWAERYDRELTDVFAVQDDVTRQIIAALQSKLGELTPTRGNNPLTTSAEAYDLYLRGRIYKDRRTQQTNTRAQELFETAIELDAAFAAAYAELGHAKMLAWYYGWSEGAAAIEDAEQAALKAVALDRSLPQAHDRLAWALAWQNRVDEAITAARQATALDTNFASGYSTLSTMLSFGGESAEALAAADIALRLDPYSFTAETGRGQAHFIAQDYEQAITDFRASLALNPDFGAAHQYLAATYGLLGYEEEARAEAAEVLRLTPNFAEGFVRSPFRDRAVLMRLIEGLRKAGLDVRPIPD